MTRNKKVEKLIEFTYNDFKKPNLHTLYFFVTTLCNLKCKYCYVPHDIINIKPSIMQIDLADSVLNELFNHLHMHKRKFVQIRFLGGEPLINFNLIKHVVHTCERRKKDDNISIIYGMNTNGTMINDDTAKWLSNYENFNVIVSLDNDEKITNNIRCHKNEESNTFKEIIAGIKNLQRYKKDIAINCVVGSHNKYNLSRFMEFLHSIGVKNIVLEFASIPIEIGNKINLYQLSDKEKLDVLKTAQIYAMKYNINISGEWKYAVAHNIELPFSPYFCNAGIRALVISPDANVYACQRFVGRNESILTKVKKGFIESILIDENEVYEKIVNRSPFINQCSKSCKLDSGGCVNGESASKSSAWFYEELIKFYNTLPNDQSIFNDYDRKVHGMYFDPKIY